MFEHILKLFTEEPEKLKKAGIKFIVLFNSLLLSLKLYEFCCGKFKLLDLKNYEGLINFLLSGKVLISIFVFMVSYYSLRVIMDLLNSTMTWLMKFLFGKKFELEGKYQQSILKRLHVLEYKEITELPQKGRNFNTALEATRILKEGATIEEIRNQITFKYKEAIVATFLIYFFVLNNQLHFKAISVCFIMVTFGIYFFEYMVENLIDFVNKGAEGWNYGFELIDVTNEVKNILAFYEPNLKWELHQNAKKGFAITKGNRNIKLIYLPHPLKEHGLIGLTYEIRKMQEQTKQFVILIKPDVLKNLQGKMQNTPSNIEFIEFENNLDLKIKLHNYLDKEQ